MSRSVSIVIPNYNGSALLEANLPYVFEAAQQANIPYEVIVSDDASTDNSIQFLESSYPQVHLIKSQTNQGFGSTINKGIFAAKYELVLALNSDVVLTPNYLIPLLDYFNDPDCFAVVGKIVGLNDNIAQDTAKYPNCRFANISGTTNYTVSLRNNEEKVPSFFTSGANSLYCREKIVHLGGFTELYSPFYGEDLDLSLKAWRLGWRSYYEGSAVCRHPSATTINKYNNKKKIRIICRRNKLIMHFSHLNGAALALFFAKTLFRVLFSWVKADWVYYQGFKLFISNIPDVVRFRQNMHKMAKDVNRELLPLAVVVRQLQKEISLLKDNSKAGNP
jgi:GT2 family glycosyltransferase